MSTPGTTTLAKTTTTTNPFLSLTRAKYNTQEILTNSLVYGTLILALFFIFLLFAKTCRRCLIPRWGNPKLPKMVATAQARPSRIQVIKLILSGKSSDDNDNNKNNENIPVAGLVRSENSHSLPLAETELEQSLREPPPCICYCLKHQCCRSDGTLAQCLRCECSASTYVLQWCWAPYKTSELQFVRRVGLDGYLLFRTMRLLVTMMVIQFCLGFFVLFPTNLSLSTACDTTSLINLTFCNQSDFASPDGEECR